MKVIIWFDFWTFLKIQLSCALLVWRPDSQHNTCLFNSLDLFPGQSHSESILGVCIPKDSASLLLPNSIFFHGEQNAWPRELLCWHQGTFLWPSSWFYITPLLFIRKLLTTHKSWTLSPHWTQFNLQTYISYGLTHKWQVTYQSMGFQCVKKGDPPASLLNLSFHLSWIFLLICFPSDSRF